MKKILVTGGMGYIGSHTTVELVQAGFDVVIVDNLGNSQKNVLKGIEAIVGKEIPFYEADCCDKTRMAGIFKESLFDAIIHFAAHKAVGESVHEPLSYYRNNLGSLMSILELMREYNVRNLVFSSSCTVYGQPELLPVTEQSPRREATSPYGNTKHMCEDIIRDSVVAYDGISSIALRYFNPIGAHPSALIGEFPSGIPNNLIPYVTQTAAGIREQLTVFGDDYDTPDGSCIRDYIDVVDLAKAHVAAVGRMLEGRMKSGFEVFNLGTGRGVSTLEIVRAFEKANGLKLKYKIGPRREGDIMAVWADPTLANEELGWKAERSLEQTLRSAWNWQKHLSNL